MAHHTSNSKHGTVLSAGSLNGTRVVNATGDELGTIKEVMLHTDSGDVAYAVLSFGGFLGMGDKLFAVPWDALTVDTAREEILLDVPRETLENAPGFDKDDWPMTPDDSWFSDLHSHYGYEYRGRGGTGAAGVGGRGDLDGRRY
jgi:sporulation protein YlmC with PRC-barrel domain